MLRRPEVRRACCLRTAEDVSVVLEHMCVVSESLGVSQAVIKSRAVLFIVRSVGSLVHTTFLVSLGSLTNGSSSANASLEKGRTNFLESSTLAQALGRNALGWVTIGYSPGVLSLPCSP